MSILKSKHPEIESYERRLRSKTDSTTEILSTRIIRTFPRFFPDRHGPGHSRSRIVAFVRNRNPENLPARFSYPSDELRIPWEFCYRLSTHRWTTTSLLPPANQSYRPFPTGTYLGNSSFRFPSSNPIRPHLPLPNPLPPLSGSIWFHKASGPSSTGVHTRISWNP